MSRFKYNLSNLISLLTAKRYSLWYPIAIITYSPGWSKQFEASFTRIGCDGAILQTFFGEDYTTVGWRTGKTTWLTC